MKININNCANCPLAKRTEYSYTTLYVCSVSKNTQTFFNDDEEEYIRHFPPLDRCPAKNEVIIKLKPNRNGTL